MSRFEREAEEIADKNLCLERMCYGHCSFNSPKHHRCGDWHRCYQCAKEGAELAAGATESGVQWHKVADGDIPPDRHNVLSEKGEIVVMKDMRWYEYSPNYDNILQRSWEEPKYWCEIPKFEAEL